MVRAQHSCKTTPSQVWPANIAPPFKLLLKWDVVYSREPSWSQQKSYTHLLPISHTGWHQQQLFEMCNTWWDYHRMDCHWDCWHSRIHISLLASSTTLCIAGTPLQKLNRYKLLCKEAQMLQWQLGASTPANVTAWARSQNIIYPLKPLYWCMDTTPSEVDMW